MDKLWTVDWPAVFVPALGLPEIMLRGTLMYLALFLILRFVGNRQYGTIGPADLLVIVLIADAAQNALGAEYRSVTEGAVLVMTIIFWNYVIDWAQYRFPLLRKYLESPAVKLIVNGRVIRKNLQAEMITPEELMSQLRSNGVEHITDVKSACLESDGKVSVITKKGKG